MVCVLQPKAAEPLDIDGFLDAVREVPHAPFTPPHVDACAGLLARLNACPDILWRHLETGGGLEGWLRSFNAPQSFVLGVRDGIAVRVNIWMPPKASAFEAYQRSLYAYQLAHNHDFRFLTIGHFGPGYQTDLFEIEHSDLDKEPGESVAFRSHQRAQLSKGTVIYFEPYTDLHVQHEPSALSISINLLFTRERRLKDQMFFDVERGLVVTPPADSIFNRRLGAMRMAALLGNGETRALLEDIAAVNTNPRLRRGAERVLAES